MDYRTIPNSGLAVSTVGVGCNNFGGRLDAAGSEKVIHAALDAGITLFDTADVYPLNDRGASEDLLGKALGARRKDVVVATKFGLAMDDAGRLKGGSRRYIMAAVEASLSRLGTDWIDLYQFHSYDPATPIEETLRALDDLVRQGKVRYIGNSNFNGWQAVEAEWTARHLGLNRFVTCQNEYSLLWREIDLDLMPVMEKYGLGLLPYFPLAGGLLSGKYEKGADVPAETRMGKTPLFQDIFMTEENWATLEKLREFVQARGHTLLELAFSWMVANPLVSSVIAGVSTPEQVAANIKAAEWALTPEDLAEIDEITAVKVVKRH